jgi:hypothetical protein
MSITITITISFTTTSIVSSCLHLNHWILKESFSVFTQNVFFILNNSETQPNFFKIIDVQQKCDL